MLFGKRGEKQAKLPKKGAARSQEASPDARNSLRTSEVSLDTAERDRELMASRAEDSSNDHGALLVTISSMDQLERSPGSPSPAQGAIDQGWLRLAPGEGGVTTQSFPAREGDVFEAKATIVLLDQGLNNVASRVFFGPVFCDSAGKVLLWWKPFEKPVAEQLDVSVEARAPVGAAEVRLGLSGTWDSSGTTGDYVVGFANARLLKRSA